MNSVLSITVVALTLLVNTILLTSCGGGSSSSDSSPKPIVTLPNASISGPSNASEGTEVTIVAATNVSATEANYQWTQTSGLNVSFDASASSLTFTTPTAYADYEMSFELVVSDGKNSSSAATFQLLVEDSFSLQESYLEASVISLSSTESFLQIGQLARDVINQNMYLTDMVEYSCSNGGIAKVTLSDQDSDGKLSNQDDILVTYSECYLDAFNEVVSGDVNINVSNIDSVGNVSGVIDMNHLLILDDQTVKLPSRFEFKLGSSDNQNSIEINQQSNVVLYIDDQEVVEFVDVNVSKIEDLAVAKYYVTVNGEIKDILLGGSYQLSQTVPWAGHFNEYPHEGELILSNNDEDEIVLLSNFVTDSYLFNLATDEQQYSYRWNDAVEGSLWMYGDNYNQRVKEFRSDNFQFIDVLNSADTELPLEAGVSFLFSREIEQIQSTELYFEESEWPYSKIDVSAELDGAILTLFPVEPLKAGTKYRSSSLGVVSKFDTVAYSNSAYFTTSDNVLPEFEAQSSVFRYGDTPILNASLSQLNEGQNITYFWEEISNHGIEFDAPSEAITSFTVPVDIEGDVVVKLTVSNEYEDKASKQMTIYQANLSTNFLFYDSESGDYIGGGQTMFHTDTDGSIFSSSDSDRPNYVEVRYTGDARWSLDLASPNNEILEAKKYEEATRYPFQSQTKPGLSFTGNGRGCNQSFGEFEILEIEYEENGQLDKLAVNFTQHCEGLSAPKLKGMVRLNSSARLNP
ncbi:hypothetical protein L0668_08050 [Paraglaciecola aquimarina]|uniref:Ig-like domain-containing protein n=1 Tax=Paraglaciecola algarum TaxID=3050085 RepID=A0ABS9D8C1_9ALTE|nr:hypothetical protein [Paraglaciecola sp. G1-23]MCF2948054.1 hypothetical protein [Paraglaciecola sp. G1-23]